MPQNDRGMLAYNWVFSIEIPVVRPSEREATEIYATARMLAKTHRRANVVYYPRKDGTPMRDDVPITDAGWMKAFKRGRWYVEGWNYDPGTTAQIYLRKRKGAGAPFGGKIVFVKDGEMLGFNVIGGSRKLFDYYRDMKKFGMFIP